MNISFHIEAESMEAIRVELQNLLDMTTSAPAFPEKMQPDVNQSAPLEGEVIPPKKPGRPKKAETAKPSIELPAEKTEESDDSIKERIRTALKALAKTNETHGDAVWLVLQEVGAKSTTQIFEKGLTDKVIARCEELIEMDGDAVQKLVKAMEAEKAA